MICTLQGHHGNHVEDGLEMLRLAAEQTVGRQVLQSM